MADKRAVGWIFRIEVGDRTRIKAQLRKQNGIDVEAFFVDSNDGAAQCRDWVTKRLARDDWQLQDVTFLGYRVIIPTAD